MEKSFSIAIAIAIAIPIAIAIERSDIVIEWEDAGSQARYNAPP